MALDLYGRCWSRRFAAGAPSNSMNSIRAVPRSLAWAATDRCGCAATFRWRVASVSVAPCGSEPRRSLSSRRGRQISSAVDDILEATTELEGHGDNVAASTSRRHRCVRRRPGLIPFRLGPVLSAASFIAWVPDVTTSTNASRRSLPDTVARVDAVHNIGRATQFALAFAHDDPDLLRGAADDHLHQAWRVPSVAGAGAAIEAGGAAGAWCAWLSGSGPTVGMLCDSSIAADVACFVARKRPHEGAQDRYRRCPLALIVVRRVSSRMRTHRWLCVSSRTGNTYWPTT